MPEHKPYELLDAEQLAADPFFQQWVLFPSPEDTLFWQNFLCRCPWKKSAMDEARRIIEVLHAEIPDWSEAKVTALKARLEETIGEPLSKNARQGQYGVSFFLRFGQIAACFLLAGFLFWQLSRPDSKAEYAASYGQTRQVKLPDGSVVNLNSNSVLSFSSDLHNKNIREVWLKGEAFFSVKHTAKSAPFIVHSGDISIEVLGTEFNVFDRHNTTAVMLKSGKVKIKANKDSVILQPGELAEFKTKTRQWARRKVRAELYSSWKEHVWKIENESAGEVAQRIKDCFGVEVIFKTPALANERISGSIRTGSIEEVREILSAVLKVSCELEEDKLIIE